MVMQLRGRLHLVAHLDWLHQWLLLVWSSSALRGHGLGGSQSRLGLDHWLALAALLPTNSNPGRQAKPGWGWQGGRRAVMRSCSWSFLFNESVWSVCSAVWRVNSQLLS